MRAGRLVLSVIGLCSVAACSSVATGPDATNIYGSPFGQGVVGNSEGVMVGNVWNEMDAFPVAEKWCKQYGKAAQFKSLQGYRAAFDCV